MLEVGELLTAKNGTVYEVIEVIKFEKNGKVYYNIVVKKVAN